MLESSLKKMNLLWVNYTNWGSTRCCLFLSLLWLQKPQDLGIFLFLQE